MSGELWAWARGFVLGLIIGFTLRCLWGCGPGVVAERDWYPVIVTFDTPGIYVVYCEDSHRWWVEGAWAIHVPGDVTLDLDSADVTCRVDRYDPRTYTPRSSRW